MKKSTKNLTFLKVFTILLIILLVLTTYTSYKFYGAYNKTKYLLNYFEEENDLLRFSLGEARGDIDYLQKQVDESKGIESQFYEYEYLHDEIQMKYHMLQIDYELLENYKFQENKKIVYLTFDDGPSKETLEMLKVLKQYNVKATFFVNKANKDILKEIYNQGHLIANHTSSHQYKNIYASKESFAANVKELEDYVYEITGHKTNIFRFPGGSNTAYISQVTGYHDITQFKEVLSDMGYVYFDWNVDSGDASGLDVSTSTIANNVLEQCKGKKEAIVLMHTLDSKHTTTLALPIIIEGLLEQGFTFALLSKNTAPIRFLD